MIRSRLCRCPVPDPHQDGDGVRYCGHCEELLPDSRDELLAGIVVKLDRLARDVEHLSAREIEGAPSS